ncbi:MAG: hypothetical protein ACYSU8_09050, partial [Planctomycetota bacterium]
MSLDNSICYCSFETEEQIKYIIESYPHTVEEKNTKHIRWHIYITDVKYDVVSILSDGYYDEPDFKAHIVKHQGFAETGRVDFRLTSKMCAQQDARFLEIILKLINIPSKPIAGLFNGEEVLIRFDGKTVQIPDKSDFWSKELLDMLHQNVIDYP